eukprot:TRINITY_DN27304_c0_g1_i1.p1 TRINITY_DN27304_c0_g1~~TRINITY_DN27304_c0_g1_i1.p1  ORF type:complete len:129 (-),score=35.04 TRINITY_DN27304_c0_g1_i1:52-438(-)
MSNPSSVFKQEHPFEKRVEVAEKIRSKYPDRIPVIVEKSPRSDAPPIEKKKFLVPQDITVGKFMFEIRKHMPMLKPEDSIFLFVQDKKEKQDVLPTSSESMSVIYEKHRDDDGFLYITYSGENTFGAF